MKVLIFGSNGQDGYYLSKLCKRRGCQVVAASRHNADHLGSIADPDFVRCVLDSAKPDIIFNLAALSSTAHASIAENNLTIGDGTLNILEAVDRLALKCKVFLSGSVLQFTNRGQPIDERTPWDSETPYAAVRNYSNFLARYYRTRGVNVYFGYLFHHESPRRPLHHIARAIADAAMRGMPIKINDATVMKEWNYAGDMVEAMWAFIHQDEIFEMCLGSGEVRSIYEWADACYSSFGLHAADFVEEAPLPEDHLTKRYQSDPKLLLHTGWRPRIGFDELARMMTQRTDTI